MFYVLTNCNINNKKYIICNETGEMIINLELKDLREFGIDYYLRFTDQFKNKYE